MRMEANMSSGRGRGLQPDALNLVLREPLVGAVVKLVLRSFWLLSLSLPWRSGYGTNRNCSGTHGISAAEGIPAAPSALRRQPPLTQLGRSRVSSSCVACSANSLS